MSDQILGMRDTARQMQTEAIRLLIDAMTLERQASAQERAEQVAMDRQQPLRHGSLTDSDAAAGDVPQASLPRVHDAKPSDPGSGVEAENSHHGSYDNGLP